MFIIRGKPSIDNYFFYTILFTSLLVAVVIAMYFIPNDRTQVSAAVAVLTVLSLASNLKLISLLSRQRS